MIRAFIIDDEKASAELLSMKINKTAPDLQIKGIYHSGDAALAAMEVEEPDVIFLDIEMPGMDGITVARKMDAEHTEIIFTTAYDKYAIDALRVKAVDYLLKPIDEKDLGAALLRLRQKLVEKEKLKSSHSLENIFEKMQALNKDYDKIAIST